MLTVRYNDARADVAEGQVATIGRSDDAELTVSDPRVSREHLRVNHGPEGWLVESIGRTPTFVNGQPVGSLLVSAPIEVRLAAPDGPLVRFELAAAAPSAGAAPPAAQPVPAPPPAVPQAPAATGDLPTQGVRLPVAAGAGAADAVAAPAFGTEPDARFWTGPNETSTSLPGGPPPTSPPSPQAFPAAAAADAGAPAMPAGGLGAAGIGHRAVHLAGGSVSGAELKSALRILAPVGKWVKDPAMRRWDRLAVIAYGLAPILLLIGLQNESNPKTFGWAYSLYVAPLWGLVFWHLTRPGKLDRLAVGIAAVFVVAEYLLIPILTLPWEDAIAPKPGSENLFGFIFGVGLAEEFTKALPVIVVGYVLLRRGRRLDPRMWMFLATISGLMFGVSESAGYVKSALISQLNGQSDLAQLITQFAFRVFLDGFSHAVWAGIAGFFIGLGLNYPRRRLPLLAFGIFVPSILHGLNDWSLSGVFGSNHWPWVIIQAFSLFLFIGYASHAASIESDVRKTPTFRGESILVDPGTSQPTG